MGQLSPPHDRHLVPRLRHHRPPQALQHHRHLRPLLHRPRLRSQRHHRQPVAIRNRPAHRPHVSALHLLHDHRPQNHSPLPQMAIHRRSHRRDRRNHPPPKPNRLRPLLRPLPSRPRGPTNRRLRNGQIQKARPNPNSPTGPHMTNHLLECGGPRRRFFPADHLNPSTKSNNKHPTLRANLRTLRLTIIIFLSTAALLSCNKKPTNQPTPQSTESSTPSQPQTPTPSTNSATTPQLQTSSTQSPTTPQPRPSGPIQFTDITSSANIHFHHTNGAFGKKYLPETMGSGVCIIDYDNDGWPDIFLVNSMDWPGHSSAASTHSYPAL